MKAKAIGGPLDGQMIEANGETVHVPVARVGRPAEMFIYELRERQRTGTRGYLTTSCAVLRTHEFVLVPQRRTTKGVRGIADILQEALEIVHGMEARICVLEDKVNRLTRERIRTDVSASRQAEEEATEEEEAERQGNQEGR